MVRCLPEVTQAVCKHVTDTRREGTHGIVVLPCWLQVRKFLVNFNYVAPAFFFLSFFFTTWFPLSVYVIRSVTDFIGLFWCFSLSVTAKAVQFSHGPKAMWSWENIANTFVILLSLSIWSDCSLPPTSFCRTLLFSYIWTWDVFSGSANIMYVHSDLFGPS